MPPREQEVGKQEPGPHGLLQDRQVSAWPAVGQTGECIRLLLLAAAVGLTMKTRASCDL